MAAIKLSTFGGLLPQISPRLLPDTAATVAENARLESGRLEAYNAPLAINDHNNTSFVVPTGTKTIYKHRDRQGNGYWLVWTNEVHPVPSPIAEDTWDRLYWTGDSYPRYALATEVAQSTSPNYTPGGTHVLGIPQATNAPAATVTGTATDPNASPTSRAYTYTWVSGLGEEGQPSPASNIVDVAAGQSVTVTFSGTVPSFIYNSGGQPALRRLYRTNANGEFQFVTDILASVNTYSDTKLDEELGEIIPSSDWTRPPYDDLSKHPDGPLLGLTSMPNGILAGYTGKSVFFSEAFLPHAFPRAYSLTTKSKIMGLASISIGLMVLTQGKPVLMTGSSPGAMGATEIDSNQACVSSRSIVDMGETAIYASPDGLVAAGESGVNVITTGMFTRNQWQALKPSSIHAYPYEGRYVFFYDTGTVKGGYILDPRGQTPELITLNYYASAGYNDPLDDALYLVITEGTTTRVHKFDAGTPLPYTWQSKELRVERPINPGCAIVDADAYPVTFTLYADGVQKHEQAVANSEMFRLPGGYMAKEFQFKLTGTVPVNQVLIADKPDELQ